MEVLESETALSGEMIYIELKELEKRRELLLGLSFPSQNLKYALMILGDLKALGVKEIAFAQRGNYLAPAILGKGYRGIVLRARLKDNEVALKILRTDSTILSLEHEAKATSLANSVDVGPLLLGYSERVLVLEFIEGDPLEIWLSKIACEEYEKLRTVLRKCFEDARKLDLIGLDHGELNNLRKHVIVKPNLKPVIIDFGKASAERKPSNITSLFSYLTFGPYSRKVLRMLEVREPPLKWVREYKRKMSDENFRKLMEALNLD